MGNVKIGCSTGGLEPSACFEAARTLLERAADVCATTACSDVLTRRAEAWINLGNAISAERARVSS